MFSNHDDMIKWIKAAEDEFGLVQSEYQENRRYYENRQAPTDEEGKSLVPKEYSYLVINKIKPHVNLQVSKVIGGEVDVTLKGENIEPLRILLEEIKSKNKFQSLFLEKLENFRHVEGLAGGKFVYDPYKDGAFGLGFPEFHAIKATEGEILLDPNASDGTHEDDQARAYRKRITLKEALNNPLWRHKKDEIRAESNKSNSHEDRLHVNLYEIEFIEKFLVPAFFDPEQGRSVPVSRFISKYESGLNDRFKEEGEAEEFTGDMELMDKALDKARLLLGEDSDDFDQAEFINSLPLMRVEIFLSAKCIGEKGAVLVEPPRPTGYSGFTIIPCMHTIRQHTHKYPASDVFYLRHEQDRINMLNSMIVESVKKGLKNFNIITGVNEDDEKAAFLRKYGRMAEVLFLRSPEARVNTLQTPTIPTQILQALEIANSNFEQIGATNEPDRGQPIDLSGKAIQALQARSDIPVYVATVHLQNSLTELFRRLIECIQMKMTGQFSLQHKIEDELQKIYFNTPTDQITDVDDNDFFVLSVDESGRDVINDLSKINVADVEIEITTNTIVKKQDRVNKAIMMYNLQQLHPMDLHKAVFPNRWSETFEEATNWNQSMQLARIYSQLTPEGMQHVGNATQEAVAAQRTADDLGFKG
jgi:hypothetical protein